MKCSSQRSDTRIGVAALVSSALLCVASSGVAQPKDPPPLASEPVDSPETTQPVEAPQAAPSPPVDPAVREAAKKNADESFKAGRVLWKKGQWAGALLQYEASMRAYPSGAARNGIAACLVKLQRYDEALDAFESTVQEFGDKLPAKTKAAALEQMDLMRRETGAFVLTGAAPGALVFVDGRVRGEHPLSAPVPTMAGRHWIRVYKEGFVVYEKDINTPKGAMETLAVTLQALPNAGRLKVGEIAGRKMEVVVDGVPVGVTPWEGAVSPGPHAVSLRPLAKPPNVRNDVCDSPDSTPILPDAADPTSAEMGTEPMTVDVKEGQTTPLDLKAERLGAVVRIVPEPPDAEVYIDGVLVGRGPYIGRAKPGKHVVKTKADGYFAEAQELEAKTGEESSPPLVLKKDVNARKWAVAGRVLLEVRGGVPLGNTFGGDLDAGCTGPCQQSLATGVNATFRAGYEFPNGVGLGAALGYFQLDQSHVGFAATIGIDEGQRDMAGNVILVNHQGRANDSTLMQNIMVGVFGSYKLNTRFPVRLGLGAGLMYGNVAYERTGTFDGRAVGPLQQTGAFPWIYIEPEARIGVQITERWSLGVAISGLVLVAPKIPVWTRLMQVNAHGDDPDQLGTFQAERVTASALFTMNQGLYLQYGF